MTLSIVLAVLFSALLHAIWNSLAHAVPDRLVGFALIGMVDAVASPPRSISCVGNEAFRETNRGETP